MLMYQQHSGLSFKYQFLAVYFLKSDVLQSSLRLSDPQDEDLLESAPFQAAIAVMTNKKSIFGSIICLCSDKLI